MRLDLPDMINDFLQQLNVIGIPIDTYKNHHLSNKYAMYKKIGGTCKKICLKHIARKPTHGSRYSSGQVRCQICEIFMTSEGTENGGRYCKCCNYRVRSKPRTKRSKKIFNEKIQNDSDLNYKEKTKSMLSSENNSDYNKKNMEFKELSEQHAQESDIKKSTPIYEKVDESVKTFYEFRGFLESIQLQTNYQLVMLKELLDYGQKHKGEIAESLAYFNNKDPSDLDILSKYFNIPVHDVLLKHGFVKKTGMFNAQFPYYSLNVNLTENEKIFMLENIVDKIAKYNKEHGIPDNEFPNADNLDNIDWAIEHKRFPNEKIPESIFDLEFISDKIYNDSKKLSLSNSSNKNFSDFDNEFKICIDCKKTKIPVTKFNDICDECKDISVNETSDDKIVSDAQDQSSNSYDYLTVENLHDKIQLNKFKKLESNVIKKTEILSNDQIVKYFGVGNMGGIRYSKKNNFLILLITHSNSYDDYIDIDSGFIIYSGEGRKGDQKLDYGNKRILDSKNTLMLLFKEKYQKPGTRKRGSLDNLYGFMGIVEYRKHYWKTENDRRTIKFVLEIKS